MGAILDFISGKSTDWDEYDRASAERVARAREYRESHPEEFKRFKAYCKYCGTENYSTYDSPSEAIKHLQSENRGCGAKNHEPEIQEIYL